MNGRGLTLVNAAGCLLLGLLLVLQWRKEWSLDENIQVLKASLVAARDLHAAERERAEMLEREQEQLKDSIESMQEAAETSGRQVAERDAQVAELAARIEILNEQIKTWQAAITQRDDRIRALNADLTASRQRLDQAIAKLKAAGAK